MCIGFIGIFQNALFIEMSQKKVNMGVSKNRGIPKWMVKIMVPNPMNTWMIWGYHYFWVDTHMLPTMVSKD